MDSRLILAVAGSGKTSLILDELDSQRSSLILTYTVENFRNIEGRIREANDGIIPKHVEVRTYFSFLYSFCVRPYASYTLRDKGLRFGTIPKNAQRKPKTSIQRYVTSSNYIYAARAADMLGSGNLLELVRNRLSRHFDDVFIDEVQDFAAHDFNFIFELAKADVSMLCVGDYFQHTYDSSRDGNTGRSLYKKGPDFYTKLFRDNGFKVDTKTLSSSWRCSNEVCEFVSTKLGLDITSHGKNNGVVRKVDRCDEIVAIYNDPSIVKLFYQNHHKHDCHSNNWGNSKGIDRYRDVCVVLNNTSADLLAANKGSEINPTTKNKLYVACTRARGDLIFVEERKLKNVIAKNTP